MASSIFKVWQKIPHRYYWFGSREPISYSSSAEDAIACALAENYIVADATQMRENFNVAKAFKTNEGDLNAGKEVFI